MTYVVNKLENSYRSFAKESLARLFCVEILLGEGKDSDAKPEDYAVLTKRLNSNQAVRAAVQSIRTGNCTDAKTLVGFVNAGKNVRIVPQECETCGAQFDILYMFSKEKGLNYAYIGETCECEGASFAPLNGAPSLSQYGDIAEDEKYEFTCESCENAKNCTKLTKAFLGTCATDYFPKQSTDTATATALNESKTFTLTETSEQSKGNGAERTYRFDRDGTIVYLRIRTTPDTTGGESIESTSMSVALSETVTCPTRPVIEFAANRVGERIGRVTIRKTSATPACGFRAFKEMQAQENAVLEMAELLQKEFVDVINNAPSLAALGL